MRDAPRVPVRRDRRRRRPGFGSDRQGGDIAGTAEDERRLHRDRYAPWHSLSCATWWNGHIRSADAVALRVQRTVSAPKPAARVELARERIRSH
jgi:hypothetical protein